MNLEQNNQAEFKKVFSSQWAIAFFLMMGSFLYDILLYAHNGSFMNTWGYSFILALYFGMWLFCLWLGRSVTLVILVINFLFFLVFKEYYKMHIIPLKLYTVLELYKEGITAGVKNYVSLVDWPFWIAFILLGIQMTVVARTSFLSLKKAFWMIIGGIIASVYFFTQLFLGTEAVFQVLYPPLFLSYQQGMLYKAKWIAEIFTDKTAQGIDKQIKNGNHDLRVQMQQDLIKISRIPDHIYLIQAESLTTKALFSQKKDKPIMPFLKSRIEDSNSLFFEDKNHYHCLGSANTDFMMMSGMSLECRQTHTLIFYSYPSQIYKNIKTLGHLFKEKGYQTAFLHGYQGHFFNRSQHYKQMGFDRLIFEPDFDSTLPRGEWGVDDEELLKKALQITSPHQKTFQFIITAGMHPPYTVSTEKSLPDFQPVTELDNYLNSAYVLDKGLKTLYTYAPQDSLFIVYGDHNVPDIEALHTPVCVFYKGNQRPLLSPIKKDGFEGTLYYINSLFE